MTSSKFAAKATTKLPAVCHKQLLGLPLDYATGEPNRLTAFANWNEIALGYNVAESFALMAGPGPNAWNGWSDQTALNLAVAVAHTPDTNLFDFTLYLRQDMAVINSVDWLNVKLKPRPPFNSGLLIAEHLPPYPETTLHVLD